MRRSVPRMVRHAGSSSTTRTTAPLTSAGTAPSFFGVANDISLLDLQSNTDGGEGAIGGCLFWGVVRLRRCRQPRLWKPGINQQACQCQVAIRAETFGEQVSVWSAHGLSFNPGS